MPISTIKAFSDEIVTLDMRKGHARITGTHELLMVDEDIKHIRHVVTTAARTHGFAFPKEYWRNRLKALLGRQLLPHQFAAVTALLAQVDADLPAI